MPKPTITREKYPKRLAATNGLDLDGLDDLPGVPVVLRKFFVGDESDVCYYALKGECYIHGMMDGEAFRILQ